MRFVSSVFLPNVLSAGNIYTTLLCISIVRDCGCAANVGNLDAASSSSLSDSIRIVSSLISQKRRDESLGNSQHDLQMECLKTLEAISTNAFLSNSIYAIALPAIVGFLDHYAERAIDEAVMCLALGFVRNIATLHALKVAKTGIVSVLVKLINARFDRENSFGSATSIFLQILQELSQNGPQVRSLLISNGVINTATKMLEVYHLPHDEKMTAIETISQLVSDLFATSHPKELEARLILEIKERKTFVKQLIATVISHQQRDCHVIVVPIYGSSFTDDAYNTAARLLTYITWLFCESKNNKEFIFNAFGLNNVQDTVAPTVLFACCSFMRVLDKEMISLGKDKNGEERSHYTIKQFLLEVLSISLEECAASEISRGKAEEIVRFFKTLETCMSLSQTASLAPEAFSAFETLLSLFGKNFVGRLLVNDKTSFVALLDIVTGGGSHTETFARILGDLGNDGSMTAAVAKFGLRNRTIAALSAAISFDADDERNIDESDSSLSRVCLECLASILFNEQNRFETTDQEACAIASTIGKILSSTVLHRFYIQASREATLDSIDHSIDRIAITASAEARILCAIASSRESLLILSTVGGLEAISLLAHDGEVVAIRALRKACEVDPKLISGVDAHLSVLDVLKSMECKIRCQVAKAVLREVTIHCLAILNSLTSLDDTRIVIFQAENSFALDAAMQIIIASEKRVGKQSVCIIDSEVKTLSKDLDGIVVDQNENEEETDREQHGQIGPNQVDEIEEDAVATEADLVSVNSGKATANNQTDEATCPYSNNDSLFWDDLLIGGDFTLERAAFSLMRSFLVSKVHLEKVIANDNLIEAIIALVQSESIVDFHFRYGAMELIVALTRHGIQSSESIAGFFIFVINTQTTVLRGSRNMNDLTSSKKLAALTVSGLQNLLCNGIDGDLSIKAMDASSNLFVYIVDSLYVGPKSKRLAVSPSDGILLANLASLFLSMNGNSVARKILSSKRHISSTIRFIVMASGAESSFVLASGEGSDHIHAALELCLFYLSYAVNGLSQTAEKPLVSLIQEVEPHPGVFLHCLEYLSDEKMFGGALRLVAMKLVIEIRDLCSLISS